MRDRKLTKSQLVILHLLSVDGPMTAEQFRRPWIAGSARAAWAREKMPGLIRRGLVVARGKKFAITQAGIKAIP